MSEHVSRFHDRLLWALLIVVAAAVSVWAGWSWLAKPAEDHRAEDYRSDAPVASFELTERSGKTITNTDLKGKVWVASFIFTRCAGPCKQVTSHLAHLQRDLKEQEGVLLVSFSVDPEFDTPEVLRSYAEMFGADPERWLFVTGEQKAMYRLILDSFRLGVAETEGDERTPGNEVTHSTRLAVVDRQGHIRGYFEGTDRGDLERLRKRIAALLRE